VDLRAPAESPSDRFNFSYTSAGMECKRTHNKKVLTISLILSAGQCWLVSQSTLLHFIVSVCCALIDSGLVTSHDRPPIANDTNIESSRSDKPFPMEMKQKVSK